MDEFARRVLAWARDHGRHDLPWATPDPYLRWVSETMLQQTQVQTAIPYYQRFIARFPDVSALARASLDEVLASWSGLGYYARARNLHRAAQALHATGATHLPLDHRALMSLPGVGRSTASAILAFTTGERHAILDGNVRRVLSRYHAIDRVPGQAATEALLWDHALSHTPDREVAAYTQAIMDLGAGVCARSPQCPLCPLARDCAARLTGDPGAYPRRRSRATPRQTPMTLLWIHNHVGDTLLVRRPPRGIWGGLHSFPEAPTGPDAWAADHGLSLAAAGSSHHLTHVLTHRTLEITIHRMRLAQAESAVAPASHLWYNKGACPDLGLASPIRRLLSSSE